MVKICDAIMGTGKSQSAITYMNEHKDDKFIYITPYLEEAKRIKEGCPSLEFVEPAGCLKKFNYRKSEHTAFLIKSERNIATTHQSFKGYTPEMLEDIKRLGYTLIIDENVDVLETFDFHVDDLNIAVAAGYVEEHDGIFTMAKNEYRGDAFADMFRLLKTRELVRIGDEDNKTGSIFYWALPPDLITSFKDVFILTYLFEGQSLHHFLEIYHIPYERIGIQRTDTGNGFRFSTFPGYVPEYVSHLKDMIHVLDSGKVNEIGNDYYALSMNWFEKSDKDINQLKRNITNCYKNIWKDVPVDERLWATYNKEFHKMKGKGYTKSFLSFNARATNEYRNRTHLVYMVNVFMNVNDKKFYQKHGIEVNEDIFALSIMVQWIWRSAIRDGDEIYIYIPSKRMRDILNNWIDSVSKEDN